MDSKVIEGSVYSPMYVKGSSEATAKALELVQKTGARLAFVEYFIFFCWPGLRGRWCMISSIVLHFCPPLDPLPVSNILELIF